MGANNILLLLGPSGVGKTQVSTWLEEDLCYLRIEIDQFSGGKGIDGEGLRNEWDLLHDKMQPEPFAALIRIRISQAGARGAVIALPSGNYFPPDFVKANVSEGISTLILFGSIEECRNAFIEREKKLNRGIANERHWDHNNLRSHALFSLAENAPIRILTFHNGVRRSKKDIIDDIKDHL